MRVLDNGVYRDMTEEEIEAMKRLEENTPKPHRTLEEQVLELREALDLLLSGVTE